MPELADDGAFVYTPHREAAAAGLWDAHADDARHAAQLYHARLGRTTEVPARGRLHHELARICELLLGDRDAAAEQYAHALTALPEHLPSIVGARRVAMVQRRWDDVVKLFERELHLTSDRGTRAALLLAQGRVLEDRLGQPQRARQAYAAAIDLSDPDPALWHALAQIDAVTSSWAALDRAYEAAANALAGDASLRAAILCQRARLKELRGNDIDAAAQLYDRAFELDPAAPGVVSALERLFARRGRWRELVALLEREAALVDDLASRALVLHRCALVWLERLGDRESARGVLERASTMGPQQAVILETLARVYEDGGHWPDFARTLGVLVDLTDDPQQRLGLLHRLGMVCLDALGDDDSAIDAFEAVLELDAGHVPALRALAPLYARAGRHEALVAMHQREAATVRDPRRRATAHARAAEILERISKIPEAMTEHEHALALAPDLLPSFEALVRLYGCTSRHAETVELYERHLERVDVERRISYLFAIGDLARGPLADPEQAEHAYRRILELRPDHLGAIHALGRVGLAAQRWRTVIDALELEAHLVRDSGQRADLLHRAGEILDERLGRREEALSRLKSVLSIDGHHPPTLATLGRIYHGEKRWADLADIYERELAVATEPANQVILLHRLAELHARHLGSVDRAIEQLRRALATDPHHAPSVQLLSRILRARQSWRELAALSELERDGFRDPSSRALASFQLGRIHEDHLDDLAAAERCYLQAVELRPGYRAAADALARARTELGHFAELVAELERDAATLADRRLAVATLYRAGEVARDHLEDAARARRAFERVLSLEPSHVGALVALEAIYRHQGDRAALGRLHAVQAETYVEPAAKIMALVERVRVLDLAEAAGDPESVEATARARVDAWSTVLSLRARDRLALDGLEREAIAHGDPAALATIDGMLAEAASDPLLCAAYLTRRGEALEASGGPQALDVYREALVLDPENLGALRGLGRLADLLGDAEAVIEAAMREAAVARSPAEAADAYARAGTTRLEQQGDRPAAIAAFDQALAVWPDHTVAAMQLSTTMRATGQLAKLAERLARAAASARTPPRQRSLWLEVARLQAYELDNLGGAIASLQRLLERHPDDAAALLEIARLHLGDRRAAEAMPLLERALELAEGPEVALVHELLAAGSVDLGDHAAAFHHYEQALQCGADEADILARIVTLQLETGMYGAAVDSATRLRAVADDDATLVAADVALARAHIGGKRIEPAIAALADAIAIEGSGGIAHSELAAIATTPEHWQHYLQALRGHIDGAGDRKAALALEIARVTHERLDDVDGARATLIEALRTTGSDPALRFELAKFLRLGSRHAEAIDQLQLVLMDDVFRIEAWRALAQNYDDISQPRSRAIANGALGIFEVATAAEREDIRGYRSRMDAIRPGALAGDATADLHVARDQQAPSAALLASIVEALAKVRPGDLARWGISGRDKLVVRPDGVRALVDRIAAIFGVEDFDAYTHGVADRGVFVENLSRPALLVPAWLAEASVGEQAFAITQAIVNIARGTFTIDLFVPRELEILLVAAARSQVPGFGDKVAANDVLDDHARTITKAVGRKRRRAFEIAAGAYATGRHPDTSTFVHWIRQSARRIALVVADDLPAAVAATARQEVLTKTGIAAVRASPVIADLLKLWSSRHAMLLRHQCGMLGPGA